MTTQKPTLKETLRNTDKQLAWALCSTSSVAVAKLLVDAGYDYIMFDLEHGSDDSELIDACFEVVEAAGAYAGVKARSQSEADLKIAYDFAPSAIYVPGISSAAEAEAFVATLTSFEGTEPRRGASRDAAYVPLIETMSGIKDSTAIANIDGVDYLAVGPGDLSRDLGIPGDTHNDQVKDAYNHMFEASEATGVPVGVGWPDTSREQWAAWRERGNRFEFGMIDGLTLRSGAAQALKDLRGE